MAFPPERTLADPLLAPDVGSRDVSGAPVRAPIGNSIKTLLLLGVLVIVGVLIWWVRRPDDLTGLIGGREWVIVDVDGEPATSVTGTASTFVLDGTHEIRGTRGCNTAIGEWMFDTSSQRLDIEWTGGTTIGCPDAPVTYAIDGGDLTLSDAVMTVEAAEATVRSISLADRPVVTADELAGAWSGGGSTVEFGRRGLLRVDDCIGEWNATGEGISVQFDGSDVALASCGLAPIWTTGDVIMPVRFEDTLYLHRAAVAYPLDREVYRLDIEAGDLTPRLDGL
jgi:hypothetical protein